MKLYDAIIRKLPALLKGRRGKAYVYQQDRAWPESDAFELLLQKDTAYELGAGGHEAVNFTCVTDDAFLMKAFCKDEGKDRILLFGKDLPEIKEAHDYARITLLLLRPEYAAEADAGKTFQTLQELDFVKYNVHPKGYMVRTSNQNHREQVRIGRRALQKGMTFEAIGNTFINKYRQNEKVCQVCLIFITDECMDYKALYQMAKQTADIRNSLSQMKKGLPTECAICEIKDICNEIEGLRELHFGSKEKKKAEVRI